MFRYKYIYVDVDTGELIDKNKAKRDYYETSRKTIRKWEIPDTKVEITIRVKRSTHNFKFTDLTEVRNMLAIVNHPPITVW